MRSVLFYVILFLLMPVHAIASVGVYADKQNLTASEVLALDSFEYPEKIRSFGETKDHYWLLFDDLKILENQQFWLFLDNSALDHIQTFRVSPLNEIEPIHDVGDALPFAERPIFHRTFLLPFTLNQQDRILIRIWGETPLAFRYKMGPSNEIFPQVSTREGIIKVMYGMILSLLFYNLIMFVITRIAVYGWYVVYMGGVVLFLTFSLGVGFQFLWPTHPEVQNGIAFLFVCLFQFGAFGFTRQFLNLKSISRSFDRFYLFASYVPLLMVFAIFIHKDIALKIVTLTTLILFIIVPAAIIMTAIKKSKETLVFLLAWMCMVCGMLIMNMALNGYLDLNFLTVHALEIGVAIESILLSFALALKIRNRQRRSNEKLQKAYEQVESSLLIAQKSNQAKDSFLASVSHELKTPLHALIGSVQLLNLNIDKNNDRNLKLLTTTDISASKLFLHIDKLLIYSEIIAGDAKKIVDVVDLNAEVLSSQKQWELLSSNKGMYFELIIDSALPNNVRTDWIHCNKILIIALESTFNNPAVNHVEFNIKHTKNYVSFIISGNGKLNSVSVLQWLSAIDVPESWSELGFGFFLCQKLADLIGATLGFQQHEESWELTLDNPIQIEQFKDSHKNPDFAGKKILVVDDISVNLKIMEALVKALGATPILVDSGKKAIEILEKEKIDAVLMDCQMPELTGQQTTLLIRRSNSKNCKVPIIAVTANAQDQDRLSCAAAGMDDFIAKPIRLPMLSIALNKWI